MKQIFVIVSLLVLLLWISIANSATPPTQAYGGATYLSTSGVTKPTISDPGDLLIWTDTYEIFIWTGTTWATKHPFTAKDTLAIKMVQSATDSLIFKLISPARVQTDTTRLTAVGDFPAVAMGGYNTITWAIAVTATQGYQATYDYLAGIDSAKVKFLSVSATTATFQFLGKITKLGLWINLNNDADSTVVVSSDGALTKPKVIGTRFNKFR